MAHGKAQRASVIKSGLTLFLTALLVWVFAGVVAASDYINVPAEYYFGRWAWGILAADTLWSTDQTDTVYMNGGISYTNRHVQFGIDQLGDCLLFDNGDEDNDFSTARFSFQARPRAKWQIGLRNLQYREGTDGVAQVERSLATTIRSDWFNRDSLGLNSRQAAYTYRVGPWLPKRVWRVSNDVAFQFAQANAAFVYVNSPYGGYERFYPHQATSYGWQTVSTVTAGLSDILNASAEVILDCEIRRADAYSYGYGGGEYQFNDSQSHNYASGAYLDIKAMPLPGLYGTARFGQTYAGSSQKDRIYDFTHGPTAEPISDQHTHAGPDRVSTSLAGALTWLTQGDFQRSVLLDDYSGFYRHLLFHRQVELGLGCDYTYESATDKTIVSTTHAAIGLFDHAQVAVYADYFWQRSLDESYYIFSPEAIIDTLQFSKLDYRLDIVYRSFTYRPQHGPGWNRDSRYDIAYGPVLQLGQWVATFSYVPPGLVDPSFDGVGPFSLGRLRSRKYPTEWMIGCSVGVGLGVVAGITERVAKYQQGTHLDFQDYTFKGRVLKRIELGVEITRYGEWYRYYENRVTVVEGRMYYLF